MGESRKAYSSNSFFQSYIISFVLLYRHHVTFEGGLNVNNALNNSERKLKIYFRIIVEPKNLSGKTVQCL